MNKNTRCLAHDSDILNENLFFTFVLAGDKFITIEIKVFKNMLDLALAGWFSWLEYHPGTPRLQVHSLVRARTITKQ